MSEELRPTWYFVRVRAYLGRSVGDTEPVIINPRYIAFIKPHNEDQSMVMMEGGSVFIVDEDFENFRASIGILADEKFMEIRRNVIRESREKKAAASGKTA